MAATKLRNTVLFNNANLKALYEFESGALTTDSSGNGYTLTNNNTVAEGTGLYGGCADFGTGNTNKYLSVASDLGLTKTLSLSCWVKLNEEIAANSVVFISKSHATGSCSFFIGYEYNGGTRRVFFRNLQQTAGSDTSSSIYKTVTLGTSTWHHFSLASNGINFYCYFDGQYVGTGTVQPNGTWLITTRLTIGCNSFNIAEFSSAVIDDAFVFSTALSADQIKELYEGRFIGETWPQSGLVAGYHLNGSSTDFSGNNNHGTNTAITYSQANGKFGQGADFNGSTGFIQLPNISATLGTLSAFSISFWLNADNKDYGAGEGKVIDIRGSGTGYIIFRVTSTNFNWYLYNGTEAQFNYARVVGSWVHIAYVYDGSNLIGYLNGNRVGSASRTGTVATGVSGCFGREYNASAASQYDGKLDEVLIFNRALTAQEIRKMYAVGSGKYY